MKSTKKETKEYVREYVKIDTMEVGRVALTRTGTAFFDCIINGVNIYSAHVVEPEGKQPFISWPAVKAKNGNYYNSVYVWISPEDQAKLIQLVQDKIDEQD